MIGMDRDESVANDCQRIGQRMWGWGVRDVEGHLARLSLEDPVYIAKQLNSQPLIFFWLNLIRLGTHMAIHILHKRAWEGQYVCKSIGNLLRKEVGRLFSWRTDCYKVCFQCPPTHTNPNVLLKILKILNTSGSSYELHFLRRQFNVMKVE